MTTQLQGCPGVTIELIQDSSAMNIQRSILAPGSQIPEHSHQVAETYVVVSGHGRMTGTHARAVGPGDAGLVNANESHGWHNNGSDVLHVLCSFPASFSGAP